jgi:hypothetical protein
MSAQKGYAARLIEAGRNDRHDLRAQKTRLVASLAAGATAAAMAAGSTGAAPVVKGAVVGLHAKWLALIAGGALLAGGAGVFALTRRAPLEVAAPTMAAPTTTAAPQPSASPEPASLPVWQLPSAPPAPSSPSVAPATANASSPAADADGFNRELAEVGHVQEQLRQNDGAGAVASADAFLRDHPRSRFLEEVLVLKIRGLLLSGQTAQAQALGHQLLAANPHGFYAPKIRALLAETEQ